MVYEKTLFKSNKLEILPNRTGLIEIYQTLKLLQRPMRLEKIWHSSNGSDATDCKLTAWFCSFYMEYWESFDFFRRRKERRG